MLMNLFRLIMQYVAILNIIIIIVMKCTKRELLLYFIPTKTCASNYQSVKKPADTKRSQRYLVSAEAVVFPAPSRCVRLAVSRCTTVGHFTRPLPPL